MMKPRNLVLVLIAALIWSSPALSALYIWRDENGHHHMADRPDKLPGKFQELLASEKGADKDGQGLGYWVDDSGNYHFYDKRGLETSTPPPANTGLASLPAGGASAGEKWRGTPGPLVLEARVKDIVSGDTILLENGQKLKYIGIAFPEYLKADKALHEEAKAYQRKLLKGKTVHILFDRKRHDEKGRMLGFIFLGTDTFVNADLVLAGYAKVRTVPPNLEYRKLFMRLENFARENQFGVWRETDSRTLAAP